MAWSGRDQSWLVLYNSSGRLVWPVSFIQYISCGVNPATCVELRVLGRSRSLKTLNASGTHSAQLLITRERGKTRDEESVGQIVDEKFEQRRVGVRPSQLSHPLKQLPVFVPKTRKRVI